jgi:DNA-directed RNA polymerase specialized sigma24 family protein
MDKCVDDQLLMSKLWPLRQWMRETATRRYRRYLDEDGVDKIVWLALDAICSKPGFWDELQGLPEERQVARIRGFLWTAVRYYVQNRHRQLKRQQPVILAESYLIGEDGVGVSIDELAIVNPFDEEYNAMSVHPGEPDDELDGQLPAGDDPADVPVVSKRVKAVLSLYLSEDDRLILDLHYLKHWSHRQIQEVMGLPTKNAVTKRLRRAEQRVKKLLTDHCPEALK